MRLALLLTLLAAPALTGTAPPEECFGARPGMAEERRKKGSPVRACGVCWFVSCGSRR